jgi:hypothetical protein
MNGWTFDPSRLACSPKWQACQGYAVAAQMLRDSLGCCDIFAEVRERVRRDPQLRVMFTVASEMIAPAGDSTPRGDGRPSRRSRRPR